MITDLKTPLTKDVVTHNCGFLMVGGESAVFSEEEKEASLDMSKDVMLPGEMTFRREALTASTPAAALRWSHEIDYLKSVLLAKEFLFLKSSLKIRKQS